MTEKDLLNNKEAMKLALAFDKIAKEYKTTIQKASATALFVDSLSHRMVFNGMPIHTNRNFTSSNCDCIILQHQQN